MARNNPRSVLGSTYSRLARALSQSDDDAYQFYMAVIRVDRGASLAQICEAVEHMPRSQHTPYLVARRLLEGHILNGEVIDDSNTRRAQNSNVPHPPETRHPYATAGGERIKPNPEIDWGNSKGGEPDYSYLVGAEDAYEHTVLRAGEKVAWCSLDKVAYHLSTWAFLQDQNQGRCCICAKQNVIQIITLPCIEVQDKRAGRIIFTETTAEIISREDVKTRIGKAVVIEDTVQEVYESKTGTFFIRFDERTAADPPFKGFKVVIQPKYAKEWVAAGVSPKSYEKHKVRVRGVIQKHSEWGIEILINSPRVVDVVE